MKTLIIVKNLIGGTTFLSPGARKELSKRGRKWLLPLSLLGITAGGASYLTLLIKLYTAILSIGNAQGHPEMLLVYAMVISWIFVFFINISITFSVLYFSKDIEMLLTLPVTPFSIVSAKFILLFIYTLPIHLFFMIPATYLYTLHKAQQGNIVLNQIITIWFTGSFMVPILPIALSVLFVTLLSRVSNLTRHKIAIEIFGGGVALFIVVAFQLFITRTMASTNSETYFSTLKGFPDIYNNLTSALPFMTWYYSKPLLFSLLSVALIILTLVAVKGTIITATVSGEDTKTKRVKHSRDYKKENLQAIDQNYLLKRENPIIALVKREWAIITSNSTFLFEAASEVLIVPIIVVVFAIFAMGDSINLSQVKYIFATPPLSNIAGLIILGAATLMTGLNGISSTSISREGRMFSLNFTLPITGKQQIISKWLFHLIIFVPAFVADSLILMLLIGFKPLILLLILIPGALSITTLFFIIAITMDLKRPILTWTHPQQAMKQNLNVLITMGINIIIILSLGFFSWFAIKRGITQIVIGITIITLITIIDLILLPKLFQYAEKRYADMEAP